MRARRLRTNSPAEIGRPQVVNHMTKPLMTKKMSTPPCREGGAGRQRPELAQGVVQHHQQGRRAAQVLEREQLPALLQGAARRAR